jgi:hypothetical protein
VKYFVPVDIRHSVATKAQVHHGAVVDLYGGFIGSPVYNTL